ncbi:MAG: hypothetical protein PWQ82_1093 [Thermosediminibacterales bacterium]|nr:hypothetical protein [Thermosediminibacterales bacterium]MDK2835895.1 hypothetical protein [Thermosediminibacterales bacterium]
MGNLHEELVLLPIVGAIIGWFTNYLAIKLIFRPLNPIKIPLLGFEIQGLLPKRKEELARSIGITIETELLSLDDIIQKSVSPKIKEETVSAVKAALIKRVSDKILSFLPKSIQKMLISYIENLVDKEANIIFDDLRERLIKQAKNDIKIRTIIEEKIMNLELNKLENIIIVIAKKELKHIELLGALIGFIIGIGQAVFLLYIIAR